MEKKQIFFCFFYESNFFGFIAFPAIAVFSRQIY